MAQAARQGLCVAASLLCLLGAAVHAGEDMTAAASRQALAARPGSLAPGQAATGVLAAGGRESWRVDLPAGHVVQGEFEGQGVALDLEDAQGRHLRRLARPEGGAQSLMWVTEGAGRQRLVARHIATDALMAGEVKSATGRFALRLTSSLAPLGAKAVQALERPALESPRLQALAQAIQRGAGSGVAADAFWRRVQEEGTPMVEPLPGGQSLVTFLWRGQPRAGMQGVRLFGSPAGNHDPLQHLPGSDVWWASFRMADNARLSYRLAPDVPLIAGSAMEQRRALLATAQRDPLNPKVFPQPPKSPQGGFIDAFQGASVLELPKAPPQPWVAPRAGVAPGALVQHRLSSRVLGNSRDVWTYRPAGGQAPEALLVLFDGNAYAKQVSTPTLIDNLMADGLIPPTAVVLVDNASPQARGRELPPNTAFARFLDEELMPWVGEQGLGQPAARTVIGGSSFGGLASAYAGLVNARWFGNVLSMSGSFWWSPAGEVPGWVQRRYAQEPRQPVRFYLDAGRYERARGGQDGILETNRHLADVLRAKGYEVTQAEHETSHDYLQWQGSLACGLVALLNPGRFAQGLPACERMPDSTPALP
ncbi:enterochelin esterase domain-containing protein [Delftia acidovorans]|uniref:enterochelin esterase domain-containing protein n=2 Tax=Pseudomonadota TaxID=1224 RepID=UPI00241C02E1|nr:enterochelin esterase domain-containing protein [Delftia acidovorans]